MMYGMVKVLRGRFAGQVGYYDDDENDKCVVYLSGENDHWRLFSMNNLMKIEVSKEEQKQYKFGKVAKFMMAELDRKP